MFKNEREIVNQLDDKLKILKRELVATFVIYIPIAIGFLTIILSSNNIIKYGTLNIKDVLLNIVISILFVIVFFSAEIISTLKSK